MSFIFSKVLEMSLYGSIAILVVLLFRLIFKKCPKRVMILFWIIVALRLVLPFNFNSPTSILNFGKFVQPKTASAESTVYDPETRLREIAVADSTPAVIEQNAPDAAVIDNGSDAPETAPVVTEQAPKVTFKSVLPYIWLTVMVGMLIFSAIRYAIFYSRARWSSRSFDGRYYMANDIDSPFVVGIINPKIFFPINMDDDEREYVLNHEWTHIKN
nr:M56 family metallopeptidase [Saccharofermentans sp.]